MVRTGRVAMSRGEGSRATGAGPTALPEHEAGVSYSV
jgi:hypothetical protein